ncbi:MAG: DinB family protein [Anaerolineales bacterium]
MTDRQQLIQDLKQARVAMQEVIDSIDLDRAIYAPWKIKEVLAHIAGWDEGVVVSLKAHRAEEIFTPAAFHGIDHYNAESVSTRETLTYDHVLREFHAQRAELLEILENMPDEKFEQKLIFPWGETGSLADLVHIFSHHETEHAREIMEIISA